MFGALKPGFRSLATLKLVVNAPIYDHVAKLCGDPPRDRGDLALNKKKKKKKGTAAKHKARLCVITQRADLKTENVGQDERQEDQNTNSPRKYA